LTSKLFKDRPGRTLAEPRAAAALLTAFGAKLLERLLPHSWTGCGARDLRNGAGLRG